jgi:predicted MFS family arabinose efflux permease
MNSNYEEIVLDEGRERSSSAKKDRLPWIGLLALSMAGFIVILTEALPAGLLPQIAQSLQGSEAVMGQMITIYALGSLLAAIPVTALTQSVRRRPLLLTAIVGFGVVNTITAVSEILWLTLVARFLAGVFAGMVWSLMAGYAGKMVPAHLQGRAIAVALAGTPVALTLGIPAGTFIGNLVGWRVTFGLLSALTLVLVIWILAKVPDFPGTHSGQRHRLLSVLTLPGLRPVLAVSLLFVLTHNILYTYIAPLLKLAGLGVHTDVILFLFGIFAFISIWVAGVYADRHLRRLVVICISLFIASGVVLALLPASAMAVYAAVCIWGLAFGGAGALFNTGVFNVAGEAQDVAQSLMVTTWNIGIAGGGLVGGLLLGLYGAHAFSWTSVVLLVLALAITLNYGVFSRKNS